MLLNMSGGGYQIGDGNLNGEQLFVQTTPATATVTATLTAANIMSGMILGSPNATAATYTLPTVALLEAVLVNARAQHCFDFNICNVNGNASGVITVAVGTGWTIVGLATIAATAGTSGIFRAVKTGDGAWTLYRIA